jgi:hypothetical protein
MDWTIKYLAHLRAHRKKLIFLTLAVIALVVWVFPPGKSGISLTLVRNKRPDRPSNFGNAIFALTNHSNRPITYIGVYDSQYILYHMLQYTTNGWEDPGPHIVGGSGFRSRTLLPSQGIEFEVFVPTDQTCRVSVDYSNGEKPNAAWRKLPDWLAYRLPWVASQRSYWSSDWRTAISAPVDLQKK